jgi:hypothetical protein
MSKGKNKSTANEHNCAEAKRKFQVILLIAK